MSRLPEGHKDKVIKRLYEIISKYDKIGFNKLHEIAKEEELCSRSTLRKYLDEMKGGKTIEEYNEGQYHYFTTKVNWIKTGEQTSKINQEHLKTIKEVIKLVLDIENRSMNQIIRISAICLIYQQLITMSLQTNLVYSVTRYPKLKKIHEDAKNTAFEFLNSIFKLEESPNTEMIAMMINQNISRFWSKSSLNFASFVSTWYEFDKKDEETNKKNEVLLKKFFQSFGFKPQFAKQIDPNKS